ncbi:aldo/keto reductase [Thermospira aquatica]|uniref:Aldo/keto reductase n=1 Tax=Thermospira aquatica TaxID=2828656 RepID=A0AAX3BAN2_9SPIR|nr:aldo/keto reductase [Thermospira aquatica]URA09337.1 aldo/keto reductase [Thermospira aquatica]
MIYRKLGNNGPTVSILGYGGWALGEEGWPDVESSSALSSLEVAFEEGITLYDTAPFYGRGLSEKRIGEVLASVRHQIVIATKCGIHWNDKKIWLSLSRDDILREVEESLTRLRTDFIDLYQIHWYDQKTPLREVFLTLKELQKQGIIRHIGVCNFPLPLLRKASTMAPLVSFQGEYNLLKRDVENDILPFCRENDIGFLAYSPLAQGLLAGRAFDPFSRAKDVRKHHPMYRRLSPFPAVTLHEALSFLLEKKEVSSLLISMTKPHHVKQNVQLIEKILNHSPNMDLR